MQWEPIETCKQDGEILVYGGFVEGFFASIHNHSPTENTYAHVWKDGETYDVMNGGGYGASVIDPTNWMPLPAPPTT